MYNTDLPTRAELPTTRQLIRSTLIAILAAAAILVTIVLPAEYAIDPTGIGRLIGLTEMGEIKAQLADEAARDRIRDRELEQKSAPADKKSGVVGRVFAGMLIGTAHAQAAPAVRKDEMTVTLKPNEGVEVKLAMKKGAKANFVWTASGGVVNFDMHGDVGGKETSYEKGRGVPEQKGVLTAGGDGMHGWFWRNRGKASVTVTLKVDGDFSAIKRM
jgi:hypothetical protein